MEVASRRSDKVFQVLLDGVEIMALWKEDYDPYPYTGAMRPVFVLSDTRSGKDVEVFDPMDLKSPVEDAIEYVMGMSL